MPYKPSKTQVKRSMDKKDPDNTPTKLGHHTWLLKEGRGPSGAARLKKLEDKYGADEIPASIGAKDALAFKKQIEFKGMERRYGLAKKKKKKE